MLPRDSERLHQLKLVLGSRPPRCVNKCSSCRPCIAALVTSPHHKNDFNLSYQRDESYYLLSWKCKCKDKLFQPWKFLAYLQTIYGTRRGGWSLLCHYLERRLFWCLFLWDFFLVVIENEEQQVFFFFFFLFKLLFSAKREAGKTMRVIFAWRWASSPRYKWAVTSY